MWCVVCVCVCVCVCLQAAHNCLIGDRNVVKVAEFGMARFVIDDEYTTSKGAKFPIKWAAPEIITHGKCSSRSDVWSYGKLKRDFQRGRKRESKRERERVDNLLLSQVFYCGSFGLGGKFLILHSLTHK